MAFSRTGLTTEGTDVHFDADAQLKLDTAHGAIERPDKFAEVFCKAAATQVSIINCQKTVFSGSISKIIRITYWGIDMKGKYVSLSDTKKECSEEVDKLNQQIGENAKKDSTVNDILERVNEGKANSDRKYFISPYAPKKSRWQSAQ